MRAASQAFAPSLLPATLAGLPQTLRQTTARASIRVLALQAALAEQATSPTPEDDEPANDDDQDAQQRVGRSQGHSILTALGIAGCLLLAWLGVQTV